MRLERLCAAGLLAMAGLVAPARANTPQACISLWSGLSRSNQTQGIAQQDFMAACLARKLTTASPTSAGADSVPAGATGLCRDGAYTTAAVPLAGCDRHGGLAGLLRP